MEFSKHSETCAFTVFSGIATFYVFRPLLFWVSPFGYYFESETAKIIANHDGDDDFCVVKVFMAFLDTRVSQAYEMSVREKRVYTKQVSFLPRFFFTLC